MIRKKEMLVGMFLLAIVGSLFFVSAYYSHSNPSYSSYAPGDFSNRAGKEVCGEGQDFLLQLSPLSCSPAVVRVDLLEEQNVPVFCPIAALKVNPLIDVDVIESMTFSGDYPEEVSGVAFHPARSALGSRNDLNTPVDANVGYAVIVLKKQKNSSSLPEILEFNLTAKIKYDIKSAFGVGQANFLVPELSDEAWERNIGYYGFWNKRAFLKTEFIEGDSATLSVYEGNTNKLGTVTLKKGETSRKISIPGWDCLLGVNLKLNGVENPDTTASLKINADAVQVKKGGKFLDNKCEVTDLEESGLLQKVDISCREDEKPKKFS